MNVADYKKLVKPLESSIVKEVIDYLESQGYYVQRLNSGSYPTATGFLRGVKAGTPDIMAFKNESVMGTKHLKLLFVECKRIGGKLTQLQTDKMLELMDFGATCIVVHSVEELKIKL